MWRWITVATVGVVLGALVFCALAPPPPSLGHPPPIAVPGLSDAERVAAMLGIHGHAHAARDPDLSVDPYLPLERAVSILRRDVGPPADSRRRRAIAKLAAFGFDRPDFREAIEGLGGDVAFIEGRFPDIRLLPTQLYIEIVNLLDFMTPVCDWQAHDTDVDDGSTHIEWTLELLVPRRVDEIARSLDPQSWAECLPTFQQSHFAQTPAPCCSATAGALDCAPSFDAGSVFPKPSGSRARGRPTVSRPFFEHVCLDDSTFDCWNCRTETCDVDFETLLCVDTGYDIYTLFHSIARFASRYQVGFNRVSSTLSGGAEFGEVNGSEGFSLFADFGSICVEVPPSGTDSCVADVTEELVDSLAPVVWSALRSHKRIEFASSAASAGSGVLAAFEAELSGQLAELACCVVEEEPWGPSWYETVFAWLARFEFGRD